MCHLRRITPLVLLLTHTLMAQSALPTHPVVVPDGLGVNVHFTKGSPGELKMITDAGFTWIRMDFPWAAMEREKGVYHFDVFDAFVRDLEAASLRPIFVLDYSNRMYDNNLSPHSPEGVAAFATWAAAAVSHFKGHSIVWEMWNEPNGDFWKPQTDVHAYAALSVATGKAIHAADPGATYIGPACSTMDFAYLEECFKAGCLNDWCAVSVHPYRSAAPETTNADYHRLENLIAQYAPAGKTIPIIDGEWGYNTSIQGVADETQGKYLSRQFINNMVNGLPISIWYDWRDDGNDPRNGEHRYGIVRNAYHENQDPPLEPKPAYRAMVTLSRALRGLHVIKRIATDSDDDYLVLFGNNTRLVLVAWTAEQAAHTVDVATAGEEFSRLSHLGAPLPTLHAENGQLHLGLTDAPQFITCAHFDDAKLFGAPAWKYPPVTVGVTADGDVCHIGLTGPWAAPFKGRLEIVDPDPAPRAPIAPQAVQADVNTGPIRIDVHFPAAADAVRRLSLRLVADDGSVYYRSSRLSFAPAPFVIGADPKAPLPVDVAAEGGPDVRSEQSLSSFPATPSDPGSGPILRLTYRCAAGWKYFRLTPKSDALANAPAHATELGMWVRQSGTTGTLRVVYVDATGQTFQPEGILLGLAHNQWTFIRRPLATANAGHWGGANDGVVHLPIRLETLLVLDNTSRLEAAGELDVMNPTFYYAK